MRPRLGDARCYSPPGAAERGVRTGSSTSVTVGVTAAPDCSPWTITLSSTSNREP